MKFGIEHFVSSQRTDRTGVKRDSKRQDAPVNHRFEVNLQSIINISKVRLCNKASAKTREAWRLFLTKIVKPIEPILYKFCVPSCIYRGHCPEFKPCGFSYTEEFRNELSNYRKNNIRGE